METTLYPTPTRVWLLREIAAGGVHQGWNRSGGLVSETVTGNRVTAACKELATAGWIGLGPPSSPSVHARKPWRLTVYGNVILREHPVPFVNPDLPKELTEGFVAGLCGHRVARTEWRAGMFNCERC